MKLHNPKAPRKTKTQLMEDLRCQSAETQHARRRANELDVSDQRKAETISTLEKLVKKQEAKIIVLLHGVEKLTETIKALRDGLWVDF